MTEQLPLPFGQTLQMPVPARALGRLAARRGHGPNENPFELSSDAWIEWRAGWGLVNGIPDSVDGRAEYLRTDWLRLYDALMAIRDNPTAPPVIREHARRVLAREPAEVREG